MHRRDDDIRPESGAVLSHAPPFVFDTAILDRQLELPLGLVVVDVLLFVERAGVMPNDLLRRWARQVTRAGVPRVDAAPRTQKEESVRTA